MAGDRPTRHLHPIATLANNIEVYAELTKQPLSLTVGRNPHLLNLIEEALVGLKPSEPAVMLEFDMERPVGYAEVVTTSDADTIFYARQTKGAGYTRFVKNGKTESTQFITIKLNRDSDGAYEIINAWIGKFYPALPDSPDETPVSKKFWATHAVVHNGQSLISSTITKTCPY